MRSARVAAAAVLAMVVGLLTSVGTQMAVPEVAHAAGPGGTIVFVKDHDVWLVRPDGTGMRRVTRDGTSSTPYRSPSMSDAGVIAVGLGDEIVQLRQNGTVVRRFDPQPLKNSAGQNIDGPPMTVAISPDGSRIAYAFTAYTCPAGLGCGVRTASGVTASSRATAPTAVSSFRNPSWVTNKRLMLHGGYQFQVMLHELGQSPVHWFDDEDVVPEDVVGEDLDDAAVSRDGSRLAVLRGYGDETRLFLAAVNGNVRTGAPGAVPHPTYQCATNEDANLASPSWGPDNRSVVAAETGGLTVITEGSTCESNVHRSIAPGGSQPHWSPAGLQSGTKPSPTPPPATKKKLVLKQRPVIKGVPRVGRKVRATTGRWSTKPRAIAFRWFRGNAPIKGKVGARKVYRVRPADRGRKLSVRVSVKTPQHRLTRVRSKAVRVRR